MFDRRGLELVKQIDDVPDRYTYLLNDERLPPIFRKYINHYKIGNNSVVGELIKSDSGSIMSLTRFTMYEEVVIGNEIV